jgi:hypothetical protein
VLDSSNFMKAGGQQRVQQSGHAAAAAAGGGGGGGITRPSVAWPKKLEKEKQH